MCGTVTPASGIALRPGKLNLAARRPPLDKAKNPAVVGQKRPAGFGIHRHPRQPNSSRNR